VPQKRIHVRETKKQKQRSDGYRAYRNRVLRDETEQGEIQSEREREKK
jgi:hypothetical protein